MLIVLNETEEVVLMMIAYSYLCVYEHHGLLQDTLLSCDCQITDRYYSIDTIEILHH